MDLYIGNDNVLTLTGLKNSVSAAWLNAATVAVTLQDANGDDVAGETWPLSMAYVSSSNGDYQATLPDSLTGLSSSDAITAKITANAGAGLMGSWDIALTAKTRTT